MQHRCLLKRAVGIVHVPLVNFWIAPPLKWAILKQNRHCSIQIRATLEVKAVATNKDLVFAQNSGENRAGILDLSLAGIAGPDEIVRRRLIFKVTGAESPRDRSNAGR